MSLFSSRWHSEGDGDYSDLVRLIKAVNILDNNEFKHELEKVLDVESLLRYLVIENMVGNLDGYSTTCNNWLIYNNTNTNKVC